MLIQSSDEPSMDKVNKNKRLSEAEKKIGGKFREPPASTLALYEAGALWCVLGQYVRKGDKGTKNWKKTLDLTKC